MKLTKYPRIKNVIVFLGILGPGIIAANAGNDAGGIATYASIGATYGFQMLWGLILITISLIVVQEMSARMGVVTGKGLSDLIREEFGVKWTLFAMFVLLIANLGVTIAEFAGIAAGMELFGVSKYISIPIFAIAIWLLVTKGSYSAVEKVFSLISMVFLSYIISAFMSHPHWGEIGRNIVTPTFKFEKGFIFAFIGLVGTTISPYMQFYLQASVVDKGISKSMYKYEKADVYLGSIWAVIVAVFIIISTAATLFVHGIKVDSAADAARALSPLAGHYASALFGIGLVGASTLAAAVLPLSTSYAICEAFGWESGVGKEFKEAPVFYSLYTLVILISAGVILVPQISLINIMIFSQQINGILLPFILIFILKLINNKHIMGEYVNSKIYNIISWIVVITLIALTLLLFVL